MTATLQAPTLWDTATHVVEFELHFLDGTWETTEIPIDLEHPDDLQAIRAQVTDLVRRGWGHHYSEPWEIKRMYVCTRALHDELIGAERPHAAIIRWV